MLQLVKSNMMKLTVHILGRRKIPKRTSGWQQQRTT